jgi:hypothetical protein
MTWALAAGLFVTKKPKTIVVVYWRTFHPDIHSPGLPRSLTTSQSLQGTFKFNRTAVFVSVNKIRLPHSFFYDQRAQPRSTPLPSRDPKCLYFTSPRHPPLRFSRYCRDPSHVDSCCYGVELGADSSHRFGSFRRDGQLFGDAIDITLCQRLLKRFLLVKRHGADGVIDEPRNSLIEHRIRTN